VFLLGHVDRAEPAFADELKELVTTDHRAGLLFGDLWKLKRSHRCGAGRRFEECRGREV
jgi:hypothetical protein